MAQPSTLYRFQISLSDVDRGLYKDIDLRTAMHPSEAPPFLLTRIIAYALNDEEGLEFPPGGLSDPEAPGLRLVTLNGITKTWIEVGNPSAKKLHRAAKAAKFVKVYTYKDPEALMREVRANKIHNVEEIEFFSLNHIFLKELAATLVRDNKWMLVHNEGSLTITVQDKTLQGELKKHVP